MATSIPGVPTVVPTFDSILHFAKQHRDQFVALVDSMATEPVPIQIKEVLKHKKDSAKGEFAEYIGTVIRAEPGIPEPVKNKLVELINAKLVEDLLSSLRPIHGEEEKAIRKIRIHKVTNEGFVLMDSGEDSPEVGREYHAFRMVIGKRKNFEDKKSFKFKLDGTLYRHTRDQNIYNALAPTFVALQHSS